MQGIKGKNGKLREWLRLDTVSAIAVAGLLIGVLCIFWGNATNLYGTLTKSEIDFELIIARQMAVEKSIIPRSVLFGYEIGIFRPVLVAALLNSFGVNIVTAYSIALNFAVLIFAASWFFFCYHAGLSKAAAAVSLLVCFFIPQFDYTYTHFLFNGYYSFYVSTMLLVMGTFSWLKTRGKHTGFSRAMTLLLLAPAFLMGMQGVRMTVALYVPLLLTEAFFVVRARLKDGIKPAVTVERRFLLWQFAANIAGLFVYQFYLLKHLTIAGAASETVFRKIEEISSSFWSTLFGVFHVMDASGGMDILSVKGILYTFSLLFVLLGIIGTVSVLRSRKGSWPVLFLVLSFAITVLLMIFASWKVIARYFFMVPLLVALLVGIFCHRMREKHKLVRVGTILLLIFLCIVNMAVKTVPLIREKWGNYADAVALTEYLSGLDVPVGYGDLCGLFVGPMTNFEVQTGYVVFNESAKGHVPSIMSNAGVYSPSYSQLPTYLIVEKNSASDSYLTKYLSGREQSHDPVLGQDYIDLASSKYGENPFYDVYHYEKNPFVDIRQLPESGTYILDAVNAQFLLNDAVRTGYSVQTLGNINTVAIRSIPIPGTGDDYIFWVHYDSETGFRNGQAVFELVCDSDGITVCSVPLDPDTGEIRLPVTALQSGKEYTIRLHVNEPGIKINVHSFSVTAV